MDYFVILCRVTGWWLTVFQEGDCWFANIGTFCNLLDKFQASEIPIDSAATVCVQKKCQRETCIQICYQATRRQLCMVAYKSAYLGDQLIYQSSNGLTLLQQDCIEMYEHWYMRMRRGTSTSPLEPAPSFNQIVVSLISFHFPARSF